LAPLPTWKKREASDKCTQSEWDIHRCWPDYKHASAGQVGQNVWVHYVARARGSFWQLLNSPSRSFPRLRTHSLHSLPREAADLSSGCIAFHSTMWFVANQFSLVLSAEMWLNRLKNAEQAPREDGIIIKCTMKKPVPRAKFPSRRRRRPRALSLERGHADTGLESNQKFQICVLLCQTTTICSTLLYSSKCCFFSIFYV